MRPLGAAIAAGTLLLLTGCSAGATLPAASEPTRAPGVRWVGEALEAHLPAGTATIDPATLAVRFAPKEGAGVTWSDPAFDARHVTRTGAADWTVGGFSVHAGVADGRLAVQVETPDEKTLRWPATGVDPATTSIEFANGSGQSVPVADAFWNTRESGLPGSEWQLAGDLTMPFWGTTFETGGVGYIVPTDIDTSLGFATVAGRVRATAAHEFSEPAGTERYEVHFAPNDGGPVASALDYRDYLEKTAGITTLDEKIRRNPEAAKLIGALHAYGWGDGRSAGMASKLTALGVDRLWLGYDADGDPMSAEAVAAAKRAGYLVAPYDTWANAQDPDDADTDASVWPSPLWPAGCARKADGDPVGGFGGRGCALSSAALAQAESTSGVIGDRVRKFGENGVNSYFVDVDAVGQLVRDFSAEHPQTKASDRDTRRTRLGDLAAGRFSPGTPYVVGSETAAAWANGAVSYSHGSSTALTDSLWELQGDASAWGGYYPANRPQFFFKPIDLPRPTATAMFDPRYQVPLYQTVLHDSVVSTDRWELSVFKFPAQTTTRILSSLLRNEPVMMALDESVIDEHGAQITALAKVFSVLQKAAGTRALSSFRYLDEEHLVQETQFGDDLRVTVNFGPTAHSGVEPGCLHAEPRGEAAIDYCPAS